MMKRLFFYFVLEALKMSGRLDKIIKQAEGLSQDETLSLIAYLAERARHADRSADVRYSWRGIRGAAAYPLLGEDAQDWVSRTRREGDEVRERQWKREP